MSTLGDIGKLFSLWIDTVAGTIKAALERFESIRRIEVLEEDDGTFAIRFAQGTVGKNNTLSPDRVRIENGTVSGLVREWAAAFRDSRVTLVLRPSRFLFRPLDLPKQASEFLDGIVRAQIDRLTPWSANEAVYHWTPPAVGAGERITVTVVATARAAAVPLAQAVADLGATIVDVSTLASDTTPVMVYSQRTRAKAQLGRIRIALLAVFIATGLTAVLSVGAAGPIGDHYDAEKQQVQRRIAERRAVIRAGQTGSGNSAVDLLDRRKHATPSSVMVIEALSALLPDHTYATEVRIEGDKLQVVGVTRDAPSLIQILEQSPHFTRATFFAPTTRAPNGPGERFHIETRIRPYFGPAL